MNPETSSASPALRWAPWLLALGVGLLFVVGTAPYDGFLSDDALISLRYARRLLDGQGLTWTEGERVEGYTNLLWVLWCAGLGALGLDLVDAARGSGLAMMGAAILVAMGAPRRVSLLPAGVVGVALAVTGSLQAWARAGLETPLFSLAVVVAVAALVAVVEAPAESASRRAQGLAGLAMAAACLTRPDGAVPVGAALVAAWWWGRTRRAAVAWTALAPLVAVLAQLAVRRWYYDDWVPNTAYVKVAFASARLRSGLTYFLEGGLRTHGPLLLGASVAVALAWKRAGAQRAALAIPTFALLSWGGYIVSVGGDVFTGWRMHVPLAILAGAAGARALDLLVPLTAPRLTRLKVALGALALVVAPLAWLQSTDASLRMTRHSPLGFEGLEVGAGLRQAFGAQAPLLAVEAAGGVPYASGFPALDMLGLCDRHIARHRPADFGEGAIGHELGDGAYVFARQPDLVIFSGAGGVERPYYRSARELAALPTFTRDFAFVVLGIPGPLHIAGRFYVRRESPRLGLRRSPGRIEVPALLLAGSLATPAVYREGRGVVLHLRDGLEGRGLVPDVPPGRWRILGPAPQGSPGSQVVWRVEPGPHVSPWEGGVTVEGEAPADVVVVARAQGGIVEVEDLALVRAE